VSLAEIVPSLIVILSPADSADMTLFSMSAVYLVSVADNLRKY